MSLIIDGVDQNKANLPHLSRQSKATAALWCLRIRVTGSVVHGQGVRAFSHLQQQCLHDSNMTVTVLLEVQ